jgi:hypothetical protein
VIFLSLPGEPQVRAVGLELSLAVRPGKAIVDVKECAGLFV